MQQDEKNNKSQRKPFNFSCVNGYEQFYKELNYQSQSQNMNIQYFLQEDPYSYSYSDPDSITKSNIIKNIRKFNDFHKIQSNIEFEISNLISQNSISLDQPNAVANLIQFVFSQQYIYDNQHWKSAILQSQNIGSKGYINIRQALNLQPILNFISKYTLQDKNTNRSHNFKNKLQVSQTDLQIILRKVKTSTKTLKVNKNSIRRIVPFKDKTKDVMPVYIQGFSHKVPRVQLYNLFSEMVQIYKIKFYRYQNALIYCSDPQKILDLDSQPIFKYMNKKYSDISKYLDPNIESNDPFLNMQKSGTLKAFRYSEIRKNSDSYKSEKMYATLQEIYETKKPAYMNCFKDGMFPRQLKTNQFLLQAESNWLENADQRYQYQDYPLTYQYSSAIRNRQMKIFQQRQLNQKQPMQQEKFQANRTEYKSAQQFQVRNLVIRGIQKTNSQALPNSSFQIEQERLTKSPQVRPDKKQISRQQLIYMSKNQTTGHQNGLIKLCENQQMLILLNSALNPLKFQNTSMIQQTKY